MSAMTAKISDPRGPGHAQGHAQAPLPLRPRGAVSAPGGGPGVAGAAGGGGGGVEEQLAARAAAGDAGAFDALVTLLGGRVFAVALRLLKDRGEAEDLTQEVFVLLYRHLPEFRGDSKLSTWVYRITHNRALNRLKFLKRRGVGSHLDVDDPAHSKSTLDPETQRGAARDPDRHLATLDLSTALEAALRELPEEQRTLVVLRDLEDLSYEEVAEVTGLPLGTVKSRLHRARIELARRLGPTFFAKHLPGA
jgi:RNA polymerase sigma-70 factor (ECF subfamily)